MSETSSILSETLGLSQDLVKLVFDIILYNSSRVIQSFLKQFVERARELLPQEGDDPITAEIKQEMLNEIHAILQSEEFQREWKRFGDVLNGMLLELTNQLKNTLDNEASILLDKLVDLLSKNTRTLVNGVGRSAMSGLCAVPPLGAVCAVSQVVQTSSTVGVDAFNTFMETTLQVANMYSKLVGETAVPMKENIEEAIGIYQYMMDTIGEVSSRVNSVSDRLNQGAVAGVQGIRSSIPTSV